MGSDRRVTGTMLRDVVVCERRAWHDARTSADLRDPVASFVQLLWSQGVSHEAAVLDRLQGLVVDLRGLASPERGVATLAALAGSADHVLGGEISHGDLLGRPDLLSRIDGDWMAGDVKAGSPYMPDGVRVRREYGAQIGLYARILGDLGLGAADRAFVIGADGRRVVFDLDAAWGRTTMRVLVDEAVALARAINSGVAQTRGAASAMCGLCHWRSVCRRELEAADDLTLLAEVGRKLRDDLAPLASTRAELASVEMGGADARGVRAATPGVGRDRLARLVERARLQLNPGEGAYARAPLGLARSPLEWHLDIEADPTRDGLVYLHGVWERRLSEDGAAERFVHFFAEGPDGERDAFAATWAFLTSDPDARIYYYSRYERTSYRALQRRHPGVCTADEVEAFFSDARVIDLYTDVVRPLTEWPLSSFGLKPIAKSLGFGWKAEDASGASSISWYDEWVRRPDPALRDKIIDYNRSDCAASAVVLDGLIALPVRVGAPPSPSGVADGPLF